MLGPSASLEVEREFDKFESKKLHDVKVSLLNSLCSTNVSSIHLPVAVF